MTTTAARPELARRHLRSRRITGALTAVAVTAGAVVGVTLPAHADETEEPWVPATTEVVEIDEPMEIDEPVVIDEAPGVDGASEAEEPVVIEVSDDSVAEDAPPAGEDVSERDTAATSDDVSPVPAILETRTDGTESEVLPSLPLPSFDELRYDAASHEIVASGTWVPHMTLTVSYEILSVVSADVVTDADGRWSARLSAAPMFESVLVTVTVSFVDGDASGAVERDLHLTATPPAIEEMRHVLSDEIGSSWGGDVPVVADWIVVSGTADTAFSRVAVSFRDEAGETWHREVVPADAQGHWTYTLALDSFATNAADGLFTVVASYTQDGYNFGESEARTLRLLPAPVPHDTPDVWFLPCEEGRAFVTGTGLPGADVIFTLYHLDENDYALPGAEEVGWTIVAADGTWQHEMSWLDRWDVAPGDAVITVHHENFAGDPSRMHARVPLHAHLESSTCEDVPPHEEIPYEEIPYEEPPAPVIDEPAPLPAAEVRIEAPKVMPPAPAPAATTTALAETGADATAPFGLAILSLLLGTALVLTRRRRAGLRGLSSAS